MAPLWMRFRTFFSLALAFSGLGIIAACVGDEPPITPAPDASTPDGGDGSCSDTIQSNANCGACGHACAAGENCYAGVCKGKDPVEVGAGWRSACAVLRSGEVWCWGLNDQFQLGVDANGDSKCLSRTRDPVACRPTPVRVAGLTNVRHVSVGMNSACALRDDGSVWCWGGNEKGQLGHPNQGDATCNGTPCNATPKVVANLNAVQISVGARSACALTKAGGVVCWGANESGQLGAGTIGPSSDVPLAALQLDANVIDLAVGGSSTHACAIKTDKSVWCWGGGNNSGELGHPNTTDSDCPSGKCNATPSPVLHADGTTHFHAKHVTVNLASCGWKETGSIWCWGNNGYGMLGFGAAEPSRFAPKQVPGLPFMNDVSGRASHTCALAADGSVYCWGLAHLGQLGDGTVSLTSNDAGAEACSGLGCKKPVVVPNFKATQISANEDFVVAIKDDHTVWAWGINEVGRLGHSPNTAGDLDCSTAAGHNEPCNPRPTEVVGLPK